jgi:hypothetical protein
VSDVGSFPIHWIDARIWDGLNARLLAPFDYIRPASVGGDRITFLPGDDDGLDDADGPSICLALQVLGIERFGPAWPCGMGHDRSYRGYVLVNGVKTLLPKDTCDLLWYEMLITQGVSQFKAEEYYEGVRTPPAQRAFDDDRTALAAKEGRTA